MASQVRELTTSLAQLSAQQQQSAPSQLHRLALPTVTCPDEFSGDPTQCWGLLLQSQINPVAHNIWSRDLTSYKQFISKFQWVFHHIPEGNEVSEWILVSDKETERQLLMPWNSTYWRLRLSGMSQCLRQCFIKGLTKTYCKQRDGVSWWQGLTILSHWSSYSSRQPTAWPTASKTAMPVPSRVVATPKADVAS